MFGSIAASCGSGHESTVADVVRTAAVGVDTTGCVKRSHGSGIRVGGDLVVTAAHVVAGATGITLTAADGTTSTATVIGLDPIADTAVLRADQPGDARFEFAAAAPGDEAIVAVSRDGVIEIVPATIIRHVIIRTDDIYLNQTIERPGYELDAAIERGDSGGAVIVDGRLVGMVWSRAPFRAHVVGLSTPCRSPRSSPIPTPQASRRIRTASEPTIRRPMTTSVTTSRSSGVYGSGQSSQPFRNDP